MKIRPWLLDRWLCARICYQTFWSPMKFYVNGEVYIPKLATEEVDGDSKQRKWTWAHNSLVRIWMDHIICLYVFVATVIGKTHLQMLGKLQMLISTVLAFGCVFHGKWLPTTIAECHQLAEQLSVTGIFDEDALQNRSMLARIESLCSLNFQIVVWDTVQL